MDYEFQKEQDRALKFVRGVMCVCGRPNPPWWLIARAS